MPVWNAPEQRHPGFAGVLFASSLWLCLGVWLLGLSATWAMVPLLWLAGSFGLVAASYLFGRPAWLGKRADGSRRPRCRLLMWPYQALCLGLLAVSSRFQRQVVSKIEDGLWIGRRVGTRAWPSELTHVIDLAAEFDRVPSASASVEYLSIPILDGLATDLQRVASQCRELPADARVLIHCAQGHGRSGFVAAIYLTARDRARDSTAVVDQLSRARPGLRLSARQYRALAASRSGHSPNEVP